MRFAPRSLLLQLALALILMQLIATVLTGIYFIQQVKQVHRERSVQTLSQIIPVVETAIRGSGSPQKTDALIKQQFGSTIFRVTVINPTGVVLADSTAIPGKMENHIMRKEVQLAVGVQGAGWADHHSRTLGIHMMYYARRFPSNGEMQGIIRISMPMSRIESEVNAVIELALLVGGLMLLFTVATTFIVSRIVSSNVNTLVRGAQRFADGDLNHRVVSPRSSELEELGQCLNTMASQLSKSLNEIERSKSEQTAILESMPTGVIALDRDKNILSINKAATKILNVPRTVDICGRQLEEFIRDVDLSSYIEQASLDDVNRQFELIVLGLDGTGRELIASVLPLGDETNGLFGYLVLLDDVTVLRRLEGIRSDFSANVSHELRTPITTIKGYVETLDDLDLGNEDAKRFLGVIGRNVVRLEMIVDDLLSLSKLEEQQGVLPLGSTTVDIDELVSSVVATCQEEAWDTGIKLIVEGEVEASVHGSRQLLEQALNNLVQNGIRYSGEGEEVRIRITKEDDDDMIVVSVSDQGIGIPQELQPRLFERFFRIDKGRSRDSGGTGLGLAIVKHIMIAHGGSITVQSSIGIGSTFQLQIPARTKHANG